MNIGDKVRLLKGQEEGFITGFIDNKLVEVEIEDGFQIPVLKKDLVVVAKEEADHFEEASQKEKPRIKNITRGNEGVFIAFSEINDRQLSLHLINNTDWDIPFILGQRQKSGYKGIQSGFLENRTTTRVTDFEIKDFEQWPPLIIQMLFYKQGLFELQGPLTKNVKFRASTFFKRKQKAPLLSKDAYLFRIDEEAKPIDPGILKEKITGNMQKDDNDNTLLPRPPAIVDLHIEKLTSDYTQLSNRQMLELQLQVFEQHLDKAIASGMDEITFIHGIGNGTLKNEIHKKLSREKNIQHFEDAMKEKFGYGATLVKIN